jgi:hypothetical protein
MINNEHVLIPGESMEEFNAVHDLFREEHNPETFTEAILVQRMAQHYWFTQRAIRLQNANFEDDKKLSLYLRYQSSHERGFSKCLSDLAKLRAEKRKQQIGFESQKALTEAKVRSLNAKSEAIEIDTQIRTTIEAPLPGNQPIPFEKLKQLFQAVIYEATKIA